MAEVISKQERTELRRLVDAIDRGKRRRWLSAEERMAVILAGARKVVTEMGEEKLSIGLVAKACEIYTSRATVMHYFGSREKLIEATRASASKRKSRARAA